uniref:U3 small nucleolar RNA-associated protein 6 homolog C-terminal domain-containing protein n=1 Tax=Ciona savignyi TaxID=51511 RepID=H2YM90_CIOSA
MTSQWKTKTAMTNAKRYATDENQPSGGAEELEKILLSNPDDSMTWVRLMAVHLHGGGVGRARAVAEKAIASINFRLEGQLLNVWSALFNLENLYGCDVTMDKTIERALKQNDQLKIYQRLAKIYVTSGKREKAEEIFEKMTKKFRLNKSVWIAHMRHLMEDNRHKEAQDVMKRSILSLPKKQHMEVISRLGQLEFQLGEAERGRTLFEGLIDVCPKRTDIWGIYLDCSAKSGRVDETRQIFRRVTSLSLSSKKMKNLFKRFVEFELEFGNDETVRNVKQQAMNYVESQTMM